MINRNVLLASNYNAWPEVFNGQSFGFLNVVSQLENAEIAAPPPLPYVRGFGVRPSLNYLATELAHRSYSQIRHAIGLPRYTPMQEVRVEKNYDVFFYMCQTPMDLAPLQSIKGWRERSGVAAAFILESWSRLLERDKAELRMLDEFDHVFVLNASSIPHLAHYTSAPCTYLASATDCLLATPYPDVPKRTIDVYSMGRGALHIHQQLIARAKRDPGFLYMHDTSRRGAISDWAEHRTLTANLIKRSKFFEVSSHAVPDREGVTKSVGESCLSTRLFEGTAGGAILVGSAPDCPEFREAFDWPDALFELSPDADFGSYLSELERHPDRLARARVSNVTHSLRRHDWAHRWARVLETFGLARSEAHEERHHYMTEIARSAETARSAAVTYFIRGGRGQF
jgi:hypothetical protein